MTPESPAQLSPRKRRQFVLLGVLRPAATVVLLVAAYYLLPVGHLDSGGVVLLVVGLAVVTLLVVWQVRHIVRSPFPLLQGVQALALVIPLFLLIFADVYYILASSQSGSFNVALSKTDALYFVVTVFATVGFGDIAAVTAPARILVTVQMIGDLVVLGLVLRVIVAAVHRGRDSQDR